MNSFPLLVEDAFRVLKPRDDDAYMHYNQLPKHGLPQGTLLDDIALGGVDVQLERPKDSLDPKRVQLADQARDAIEQYLTAELSSAPTTRYCVYARVVVASNGGIIPLHKIAVQYVIASADTVYFGWRRPVDHHCLEGSRIRGRTVMRRLGKYAARESFLDTKEAVSGIKDKRRGMGRLAVVSLVGMG